MSKIYEVRSVSRRDGTSHSWGAHYSRAKADLLLAERFTGTNEAWAQAYHQRWWIEEIDTTGLFQIPSAPPPRERFSARVTEVETGEGTLNTLRVDVLDDTGHVRGSYDRNYPALYRTFEPFRQGERIFALISSDYTATAVMDLATGKVIAAEEPHADGFCPVGFYVPDWWDINEESILPGSTYWTEDRELPNGDFGFVWGCIWGDDSSWKVQYLDLSRVQQGEIRRDDRFGYIQLASHSQLKPQEFIRCSFQGGQRRVTFSVLASFDLASGSRLGGEI